MTIGLRRWSLGLALAILCSGAWANVSFFDATFYPGDYSTGGPFKSDPSVGVAAVQCATCGNAGFGLQITVTIPGGPPTFPGGLASMGFVNTTFTYDPGTQGAIISINAFVDKNLTISIQNTNGFTGTYRNTFRPLIFQGGVYYMAAIPGPSLPNPGSTGYNALSQTGLLAANFLEYDFITGTFGTTNPDFAGGLMMLGLGQISSVGAGLTGTTITAEYDNLKFDLITVPEPATLVLLGLGLAGLGFSRRKQ